MATSREGMTGEHKKKRKKKSSYPLILFYGIMLLSGVTVIITLLR